MTPSTGTALTTFFAEKGFPDSWRMWIKQLNISSQTTVVLNGVPGKWIQCKRGLRQGDPLSPYLFIIVADLLQQMINRPCANGLLQHPLVDNLPCPVLQYVDDTLIVIRAIPEQLAYLQSLLASFTAVSGLHINFNKSTFVPIGVPSHQADDLAASLGCVVASFPQTYLGLPLDVRKLCSKDFYPLVSAVDAYIPVGAEGLSHQVAAPFWPMPF